MKLYSNEIVFRGHPDKVCDQISDALLDEYLKGDKDSRCAIEVCGGKGVIFITGEVTSKSIVDVEKVVNETLNDIGYYKKYKIINNIGIQSNDIALGTNKEVGGAGDQGMMFGYACNDNSFYLPTAMMILSELSIKYDELRKKDKRFYADGKAQITGVYDENMKLLSIKDFTISYQNAEKERDEMFNWIEKLEFDLLELPHADIKVFLHMPYEASIKLKESRVKSEKLDQHERSKEHLIHAERAYLELAKKYNMTKEEVKKQYGENLDYIKYDLEVKKVFSIIKGEK